MSALPLSAQTAAESTAALGMALLKTTKGNTVLSPFSAQAALAMACAGAEGETRAQMAKALHFGPDAVDQFAGLIRSLSSGLPEGLQLSLAARLFGQSGYPFHKQFLELMDGAFRAPLEEADFEAGPGPAAARINAWVEEHTAGRIRELVLEEALKKDTRLVLVNAIHFLAPWADPFEERRTSPAPFELADGATVDVPFMRHTARMGWLRGEDFTAVGIPYKGGDFLFLAILPDGRLEEFEAGLDGTRLLEIAKLPFREVRLGMPKFRIEPPRLALSEILKASGMKAAFDEPRGSADFSGIAPRKPDDYLFISEVFHKAFIEVNEAGTEAAAATAVIMFRATALPAEPEFVELNRPFLFAIFHRPSSACLFLGRLVNPSR